VGSGFEPQAPYWLSHCANQPDCSAVTAGGGGARAGDAEDGDESVIGDPDLADEGLDGGFALSGGAASEAGVQLIDGAGCRRGGLAAHGVD
jgi:hypothetical protein